MTATATETPLAADFTPATRAQWVALVEKAIKGADFEKRLVSQSADGLRIEPLYTRADALASAGGAVPGAAPFTRGPSSRRDGLGWDIRTIIVETDPKAANAAILTDLEGGATSIALEIAHEGGIGVPPTREALGASLDGVLLDVCPVALVPLGAYAEAAASLTAVWNGRGIGEAQRLGAFGADPLGTLVMMGGLEQPLGTALTAAAGLVKDTQSMPGVTALMADGIPYHVGGASEAQELAAMLATLVAYLRACEAAGLSPAAALPKIAIGLAADTDQFLTIAKLRAARKLVWRIAEAAGAGDVAGQVKLASATSFRMMAKRDPWTNILRTTVACTAAAFGGADAIVVLPFTIALGRPDRFAQRIARNIQIVCQEESHLGRVADPAGGSWYAEKLTDDLARKAWSLFQQIEANGGMASALQSGFVQDKVAKTVEVRAKSTATGRMELTGVSAFPRLGDDGVKAEPWPRPSAAARNFAVTVTPLRPARPAEPFERLRDQADAYAAKAGQPPVVFLASLGEVIDHNVRSTWAKNFLAAGGIATMESAGYADAAQVAAAFKASGAAVTCICSSDAIYATHAEAAATALKGAGATYVFMAGRPGDREAALKTAGVDGFLFAGQNAVETLQTLQDKLMT